MTERLLQFIWQFQYFNKHELSLEGEEKEQFYIIDPGRYNTHQGPDFLEARIKIGQAVWVGHIEIHIRSSDWEKHEHQLDRNYDNVILHVVWENDKNMPGSRVPVFSLQDRIPKFLLQQYEELMKSLSFIPCGQKISTIHELIWCNWKEKLLVGRLQRKTAMIESYLQQCNMHWEEVFWWMIAKNFGITVNAEAFEAMARSIPVNLLSKHKNQLNQLEALLFGQTGMLLGKKFTEAYPRMLQREYKFYQKKYKLKPIHEPVHLLRMRPVNFPTIRLAQLAVLINESAHLFSQIKETETVAELKKMLDVTANDYWHYHYLFDEETIFQPKKLGSQMAENIIINTMVPMVFAYGYFHKEQVYKDKAIRWLESINAEKNAIITRFDQCGIYNKTAFDSQAVIELKSQYCDQRRCLDCGVGNALLKGFVDE